MPVGKFNFSINSGTSQLAHPVLRFLGGQVKKLNKFKYIELAHPSGQVGQVAQVELFLIGCPLFDFTASCGERTAGHVEVAAYAAAIRAADDHLLLQAFLQEPLETPSTKS